LQNWHRFGTDACARLGYRRKREEGGAPRPTLGGAIGAIGAIGSAWATFRALADEVIVTRGRNRVKLVAQLLERLSASQLTPTLY